MKMTTMTTTRKKTNLVQFCLINSSSFWDDDKMRKRKSNVFFFGSVYGIRFRRTFEKKFFFRIIFVLCVLVWHWWSGRDCTFFFHLWFRRFKRLNRVFVVFITTTSDKKIFITIFFFENIKWKDSSTPFKSMYCNNLFLYNIDWQSVS